MTIIVSHQINHLVGYDLVKPLHKGALLVPKRPLLTNMNTQNLRNVFVVHVGKRRKLPFVSSLGDLFIDLVYFVLEGKHILIFNSYGEDIIKVDSFHPLECGILLGRSRCYRRICRRNFLLETRMAGRAIFRFAA